MSQHGRSRVTPHESGPWRSQLNQTRALEFLQLAIDRSPDAVFWIQADARFVNVNDTACLVLGYTRDELLSMTVHDIDPEFPAEVWSTVWTSVRGDSPTTFESHHRTKEGTLFPVEIRANYFEFDGRHYICAHARDISVRKRKEKEHTEDLQRMTALGEITQAITSTLDLQTLLQLLLQKIKERLPYSLAHIALYNEARRELESVAFDAFDREAKKQGFHGRSRGFTQMVFDTRRVLAVRTPATAPRYRVSEDQHPSFVTRLGVPLTARDKCLGVLEFEPEPEREFSEKEIAFLGNLAGQVAVAIENSRLYQQVETRSREISALYDVTAAASESLDLPTVAREVIKKITGIFQFDSTRIYLFNASREQMSLCADFETIPERAEVPRVIVPGRGISGRVVETGEALIFENIHTDHRYAELTYSGNVKKVGHSFFGVFPIKSKVGVAGLILCIGQRPRRLTDEEMRLITSMANQIGVAVENGRLFEETRAKASEFSALYSIATVVNRSLDIDSLTRDVMHRIRQMFDFDAARMYLLDEERGELRLWTHEGFSTPDTPPDHLKGALSRRVLRTAEPLIFEDMEEHPEYRRLSKTVFSLRAQFRGLFLIPVKVKDAPVGVICFNSKTVRRLSPREMELIQSLSNHLGIAIENAKLFTEIKRKATELENLNRELREANQVKSDFMNAMSHELRTPLNVSIGYLLDGYGGELSQSQKEALDTVEHQSRLLLQLISNVLTLAKLDVGKTALEISSVAVRETLRHVRAYVEQLNRDQRLNVTWIVDEHLPVVATDHSKLEEILQNIIGNAFKFTVEGQVEIRVRKLSRKQRVEFTITDTGIGIEKADLDRIFEDFHQGRQSHKGNMDGVGLGLSIVKKYLALMRGEIHVTSVPGKGSSFSFTVPYLLSPV